MSIRFSLAAKADAFRADESVALIHPPRDLETTLTGSSDIVIVSDMMPDASVWKLSGIDVQSNLPDRSFGSAVVFLPRSKQAARDRIARAAAQAGRVLVDGSKTEGIESLLKDIRKRTEVIGTISKAHGKLFWFDTGADFSDWISPNQIIDDRWHVAPGVFSADGVDPGSALLMSQMPTLSGRIADLGAGWGYLSATALENNPKITGIHLVEAHGTALACARENITDPRAEFHWADATTWAGARNLDAVIMNPPFHTSRKAEPELGRAFISKAAGLLRRSGSLWMVANRHLPYEALLNEQFSKVEEFGGDNRYKLLRGTALPRSGR